jgi:hypothetical protein
MNSAGERVANGYKYTGHMESEQEDRILSNIKDKFSASANSYFPSSCQLPCSPGPSHHLSSRVSAQIQQVQASFLFMWLELLLIFG